MKICVIFSSCCPFPEFQENNGNYEFHYKSITKENAEEELNEICSENYDFYWPITQNIDSVKYLESKNILLLGSSFKFLSMTKLDMKRFISDYGFKNILNEEDIEGSQISMMVLETQTGIIALPPIIYNSKFLDTFKIESGEITFKIYDEDLTLKVKIQEIGVKAYESLGVRGSGYARVDFRLTPQGDVYVLEVNPAPAFLAKGGNAYGHDLVIETTYPGGQEELVKTIIEAKKRLIDVAEHHGKIASEYETIFVESGYVNAFKELINDFDFDGSILDLGCGCGTVGRRILAKHPGAKLEGIDPSPEMAKLAIEYSIVHMGLAENVMAEMLDSSYDHVTCFGLFHFIDTNNFNNILGRMFRLARKSISFVIEAITPEYNEMLVNSGNNHMVSFNHYESLDKFKSPPNWVLVYKKDHALWKSPLTGYKMYGRIVRFEKCIQNLTVLNGDTQV